MINLINQDSCSAPAAKFPRINHLPENPRSISVITIPSLKIKLQQAFLSTFFCYMLCGGLATIFDWGSFYLLNNVIKWDYLAAVSISFILGTVVNFSTNKMLTFKNHYKNIPLQFTVFLGGAFSALLLTYIQMVVSIEYFHLSPMRARIMITAVMLFYNFVYHKLFTFGRFK